MANYLQPIKTKPVFQNYLWGGTRFRDYYHKDVPSSWQKIAESWELSTHPNGLTLIAEGEFAGLTLKAYLDQAGPQILGKHFSDTNLPILFKLIDAKDNLSIQVHPDNEYAQKNEHQAGKTEMWYIMAAEPGSFLYYGFKEKISKKEFQERIENNTLLSVLNAVPVKKGDVFFIPSGTLHAIGKGILIAEIQQCSDLTYRIYDYGRLGDDGKPRQLHLQQALAVTKLEPALATKTNQTIKLKKNAHLKTLASCPYFTTKSLILEDNIELLVLDDTYQVLFAAQGNFKLLWQDKNYSLNEGETIFLPAKLGNYQLQGKGEVLIITAN